MADGALALGGVWSSALQIASRASSRGVVEAPNGAHFTSCAPDYGRDEAFQEAVRDHALGRVRGRVLTGDEQTYQAAVREGT